MTLNETKKHLYKEKPLAYFRYYLKGDLYYETAGENQIVFKIPTRDIGDTKFELNIPAQLLIRYILLP